MIRLKEGEDLNKEQKLKFKNTLIELYGKKKRKTKKIKSNKPNGVKTPSYKLAKAYNNLYAR